ncbi:MAG TPA: hypothetical protein EYP69_05835, partial [Bacteroidales bacterium]|nr:hypothetical protein [Bacteroidales bacterium]
MEGEIKSNEKKTMPVVKEQKKGNPLLIIILILLLIGNLILGWLYYQEKQQRHIVYVKLNNTNVEKEYIQKQLEDMTKGYEALKTDNEEMNAKIEEQNRIDRILSFLKSLDPDFDIKPVFYKDIHYIVE